MMLGITPNEAALIGAFGGAALGGIIGVVGSVFIARYTVKHSANYSGQIETINTVLGSLAATQEEMKQQYTQFVADEKQRHEANEHRAEAARWKPEARLESKVEGVEQVNKLILKDPANFFLMEAALVTTGGAKIVYYPVLSGVSTTGFSVPITHESLNRITSNNQQFFQTETFNGAIRYRAKREKDGASYTGEIPFHGERVYLHNTCFYKLSG